MINEPIYRHSDVCNDTILVRAQLAFVAFEYFECLYESRRWHGTNQSQQGRFCLSQ
jgi:hypothetical protein